MTGFDPTVTPLRKDGTRWLSGLSVAESIARNSMFGKFKTYKEVNMPNIFADRLSPQQKKILLASGSTPKSWRTILRHAKVKPRVPVTKGAIYDRPWFRGQDMVFLYTNDCAGKFRLTIAGMIIRDCIKRGLNHG